MESKRKKTLFNVIMVVLILVIAGCGVMAVGNLKGWFDKGSDSVLMTKNVKGVAIFRETVWATAWKKMWH